MKPPRDAPGRTPVPSEALFQPDDVLRLLVAPHMRLAPFIRALAELEHYGFPKRDPVFKGRYVPAVRAFLDSRAGLGEPIRPSRAPDGPETWDASPAVSRKRRRI